MYSRIYVKGKQLFYRPDGNRTEASEHAHITSFRLLTSWCGFWIVPVCKAYTSSTRSFWVRQTTSWSLQKHAVICMLATEEVMQDYLQETENHPLRLFNFHIVRWLTCPTETADTCNFICLEITQVCISRFVHVQNSLRLKMVKCVNYDFTAWEANWIIRSWHTHTHTEAHQSITLQVCTRFSGNISRDSV